MPSTSSRKGRTASRKGVRGEPRTKRVRVLLTPLMVRTLKKYAVDHNLHMEDAGGRLVEAQLRLMGYP